jgi:hypothetical protein
MKIRSLAIATAVVACSVFAMRAQVQQPPRPSEADLAAAVPSGQIPPLSRQQPMVQPSGPSYPTPMGGTYPAPAYHQGAPMGSMPMGGVRPGVPYGAPGMTAGQVATQTAQEIARVGLDIGGTFAKGKAETDKARALADIQFNTEKQRAALQQEASSRLYAQQQETAKMDKEARDALKAMIRGETQKARDAATLEIGARAKQVARLNSLIQQAERKGIDAGAYQGDLDAAEVIMKVAKEKQQSATDKLTEAQRKLDDTQIDSINLLFNGAVDELQGVDLSTSIRALESELKPSTTRRMGVPKK